MDMGYCDMSDTPITDALKKRYAELQADKAKALGPNPKVVKSVTVLAANFLDLIKEAKS